MTAGGGTGKAPGPGLAETQVESGAIDFSARFSQFEVASEPDGDLLKVVWPDYVKRAGPEVKRLYEFQVENGDLMKYMPCFCGCGQDAGHRNDRDCYVKQVRSDGSVVFDNMAPTGEICLGVMRDVIAMKAQGRSPREMRIVIDSKYAKLIEASTPTPYPPA